MNKDNIKKIRINEEWNNILQDNFQLYISLFHISLKEQNTIQSGQNMFMFIVDIMTTITMAKAAIVRIVVKRMLP